MRYEYFPMIQYRSIIATQFYLSWVWPAVTDRRAPRNDIQAGFADPALCTQHSVVVLLYATHAVQSTATKEHQKADSPRTHDALNPIMFVFNSCLHLFLMCTMNVLLYSEVDLYLITARSLVYWSMTLMDVQTIEVAGSNSSEGIQNNFQ